MLARTTVGFRPPQCRARDEGRVLSEAVRRPEIRMIDIHV